MKNLLEKIHLFLLSITKTKQNVQILSIITFFLACFSFYYNSYAGFFALLLFLLYQIILWSQPKKYWKTSKKTNKKSIKNLLIFLFIIFLSIIFYSTSNGQTNYDSLLFQEINEYRKSKGLNSLIWDNKLFKASEHHSTYLEKWSNKLDNKTVISHFEMGKLDDIKNLITPEDRGEYYMKEFLFIKENCYAAIEYSLLMEIELCEKILNTWLKSKGHRELLENKYIEYGSCSIVHSINTNHYIIFATFNAYKRHEQITDMLGK